MSEAQPENDDSHPRYPATFATAGTKTAIKVSDDALRKASNLIIAVDRTLPATRRDGITKSRNQRKCSAEANLPSFVTAGKGSQIRVSAEALKSVSEYFDDDFSVAGFRSSGVVLVEKTNYVASDEERKLHSLNSVSVIDNSLSVQPFVSVGKSLNTEVSAEASPVVGIERERDIDWSSVGAPVDVLAPMFTTAGKGAKIKVSAEALHRATKVLGDSAAGKNNPSSSIHNKVSVSGAVKQSYSSTVVSQLFSPFRRDGRKFRLSLSLFMCNVPHDLLQFFYLSRRDVRIVPRQVVHRLLKGFTRRLRFPLQGAKLQFTCQTLL